MHTSDSGHDIVGLGDTDLLCSNDGRKPFTLYLCYDWIFVLSICSKIYSELWETSKTGDKKKNTQTSHIIRVVLNHVQGNGQTWRKCSVSHGTIRIKPSLSCSPWVWKTDITVAWSAKPCAVHVYQFNSNETASSFILKSILLRPLDHMKALCKKIFFFLQKLFQHWSYKW